ncbi:MAG: glycosyltransferase [Rhodopseudomonas sp.]|nr:glycosyltransferase [Rhodopseudomonas sp.]
MNDGIRAVMLLSDGYGGFGGIAKFNRDFIAALNASDRIEHVDVLPRAIAAPIDEPIPEAVVYDRKAAAGKLAFLRRTSRRAVVGGPVDWVICGHCHLLPAAWALARCRRARLALIVHGVEAWTAPGNAIERWLAGDIDALISVSRLSAERFAAWSRWPVEKTCILPNGVDLDRFMPRPRNSGLLSRYGLTGGRVILTVARLAANERAKGCDEVIALMPRLLARYPDLQYLIVGDGLDRPRLAAKAEALGLGNAVVFAGRVDEADKVDTYNLADAFVMPSRAEGFGIVLIEAAACGLPVIGSRIDGSREALLDGELGWLIDPGDADDIYAAIAATLDAGRPRHRNAAVEVFSDRRFVQRVGDWLARTATAETWPSSGRAGGWAL